MENFDRRHYERLCVLGTKVLYRQKNGQFGLMPIKDLTLNSICFKIEHPLRMGEYLELDIIIPTKETIHVRGMVTRLNIPDYAVVQFFAFGTDERYNSMHSYQQLKQLMDEYLHGIEIP